MIGVWRSVEFGGGGRKEGRCQERRREKKTEKWMARCSFEVACFERQTARKPLQNSFSFAGQFQLIAYFFSHSSTSHRKIATRRERVPPEEEFADDAPAPPFVCAPPLPLQKKDGRLFSSGRSSGTP